MTTNVWLWVGKYCNEEEGSRESEAMRLNLTEGPGKDSWKKENLTGPQRMETSKAVTEGRMGTLQTTPLNTGPSSNSAMQNGSTQHCLNFWPINLWDIIKQSFFWLCAKRKQECHPKPQRKILFLFWMLAEWRQYLVIENLSPKYISECNLELLAGRQFGENSRQRNWHEQR